MMAWLKENRFFVLAWIVVLLLYGLVSWLSNVQLVWLWTDLSIYCLVFVISLFVLEARKREHLRAPWRQVMRSQLAMGSMIILLSYVVIGLVDSVHFRVVEKEQVSTETISLLDVTLNNLRVNQEKTYSAPFAMQAYAKETIERPEGGQARVYPRLIYGGSHLDEAADHTSDVVWRILASFIVASLLWAILSGLLLNKLATRWQLDFKTALKNVVYQRTELAWLAIFLAFFLFVLLVVSFFMLTPYYHVLGTDKVGQDVLYQSLKSIRTGLMIGTLTTLIMLPFAIWMGIAAGYFKGWVDDIIQYTYTTLNSIPGVLLIAAAVLMLQVYMANHPELFETDVERADVRLFFLCVILGITSWTGLCRLLRGEVLKLRELDYIQASQALGVKHRVILWRHIQPNIMHLVLIAVVLDFSGLVLAEAVLSYVGVGVDPIMNSWGNMINGARLEMAREPIVWWSLMAAFIFMFVLVLAANLFADAVRDAFDPRLRNQ